MARMVEQWSNNRWGWGRRLIKLQVIDGSWEVYVFWGWGNREWIFEHGEDEQGARDHVEELLTTRPEYGPWKQLTVR